MLCVQISDVTDKILSRIEDWQNRPLDEVYPILYIDAIHYSVRDNGVTRKLAAYASEKLFRSDKSYLGNKSMRVCSEEALSSKIFIQFIALILRSRIYTALKDKCEKMLKKPNYMTVPAALKELEKIVMIRHLDGFYRLDHAVTATQKTILDEFGLSEGSVRNQAKEIGKTLQDRTDKD